MMLPNQPMMERFFYKLSLAAALGVLVFSVWNGYGFIYIIVRTALAFIFIYFVGQALLKLWQSISPSPHTRGHQSRYFDVFVGEDNDKLKDRQATDKENSLSPENINHNAQKLAEGLPGQVRMDLKKDLQQDHTTKEEMARRMGWEDNQK